jgi:hypothetical protein
MDDIYRRDVALNRWKVTISLMPRDPRDAEVIIRYMCIPPTARFRAVADHYRRINRSVGRQAIPFELSDSVSRSVVADFQAAYDRALPTCPDSEAAQRLVARIFTIGNTLRTSDKMPVVIINGRYDPEHRYNVIKQNLSNINRRS